MKSILARGGRLFQCAAEGCYQATRKTGVFATHTIEAINVRALGTVRFAVLLLRAVFVTEYTCLSCSASGGVFFCHYHPLFGVKSVSTVTGSACALEKAMVNIDCPIGSDPLRPTVALVIARHCHYAV